MTREPTGPAQEEKLSPEMAMEKPELYVEKLLSTLESKSQLIHSLWQYLVENDLVDKEIQLDGTTDVSRSTDHGIVMGTAPLSAERKKLMFEEENFADYLTEKAYILSHEISHKIAALIGSSETIEKFNNLYTSAIYFRKRGRGLSLHANQASYLEKGPEEQAKEDIVELVNMYLWDKEYLQRFLAFLSNPALKEARKKFKLCNLSEGSASNLFTVISESIEEFLKEKKIYGD